MGKELKKIDFTKQDCNAIAEYIYSFRQEILIKQDALNLIEVLEKHKLIVNPKKWISDIENKNPVADRLFMLIYTVIPQDYIQVIMEHYYNGNLI